MNYNINVGPCDAYFLEYLVELVVLVCSKLDHKKKKREKKNNGRSKNKRRNHPPKKTNKQSEQLAMSLVAWWLLFRMTEAAAGARALADLEADARVASGSRHCFVLFGFSKRVKDLFPT